MSAHILQCTFGISFAFCFFLGGGEAFDNGPRITGVRFLITVNDTWAEPPGCITTVATPMIAPNLPYNKSQSILVGDCDRGPIQYTYTTPDRRSDLLLVGYRRRQSAHLFIVVERNLPGAETIRQFAPGPSSGLLHYGL
ncbi:uncharacterized protein LOC127877663 isoform X2 [Dreissena polymorpha]|uniref:uncharacterized protein LOC127877663 isoform X2 n=1 Tax=Dreissena polymorpha TaxID=45954 RepID=UPI0022643FF4|nr:uncharacterized protein LOC127877663 isoform X2 [Dreissena polymorpha]